MYIKKYILNIYCNFQEPAADEPRQRQTRSVLEKSIQVPAEEEVLPEEPNKGNLSQRVFNVTVGDIDVEQLNITDVPNVIEVPQEPVNISDLPTQKLETLSQTRKRTADYDLPVRIELKILTCACNFSLTYSGI